VEYKRSKTQTLRKIQVAKCKGHKILFYVPWPNGTPKKVRPFDKHKEILS